MQKQLFLVEFSFAFCSLHTAFVYMYTLQCGGNKYILLLQLLVACLTAHTCKLIFNLLNM